MLDVKTREAFGVMWHYLSFLGYLFWLPLSLSHRRPLHIDFLAPCSPHIPW